MPEAPHHHVYVVELTPAALDDRRFVAANPDRRADKPCLYVGMTGHTPEKRFENHLNGVRAARLVRKYGVRLRPRFYQHLNPMTYERAGKMERELARRLRKRGFAVWQN